MDTLKYKVIVNEPQYSDYCAALERLVFSAKDDQQTNDEIALLNLLIDTWDQQHNTFDALDPIELIQALMKEHQLKAKDLVNILGISKGYVSEILHYRKGLSKDVIRKLAQHFKLSQEAFNRPYSLAQEGKSLLNPATKKQSENKVAA